MTHLALRLTTRSEERNTSTSLFMSNNKVRSEESQRHALRLTTRSEA
jgi:hypothetical protein